MVLKRKGLFALALLCVVHCHALPPQPRNTREAIVTIDAAIQLVANQTETALHDNRIDKATAMQILAVLEAAANLSNQARKETLAGNSIDSESLMTAAEVFLATCSQLLEARKLDHERK